jgi:predicted aspartyl protease
MTTQFDLQQPLIFVDGEAEGPSGTAEVRLVLDTGTNQTILRSAVLRYLGYSVTPVAGVLNAVGGTAAAAEIEIARLTILENEMLDMPVLAADLPWTVPAEGLLGIDFFRDRILTIDFRQGHIDLN